VSRVVWSTFTPPIDGWLSLDTCGSNFTTGLGVYSSSATLVETAFGTATCPIGSPSSAGARLQVQGGETYSVALMQTTLGVQPDPRFRLTWSFRPLNDDVAAAITIDGPDGTVAGNDTGATTQPSITGDSGIRSVWYRFVAARTAPVTFDTCGSSSGSARLRVFSDDAGSLVPVGAVEPCEGFPGREQVTLDATAGVSYLFRVETSVAPGLVGSWIGGPFQLRWSTAGPAEPDTTLDGAPAAPSASRSATLTLGSPTPGATFECSLDSAPFASCTSPVQLDGLGEGSRTFQARAVVEGVVDPTPATATWVVDTIAPVVTITSPAAGTIVSVGETVTPVVTCTDASNAGVLVVDPVDTSTPMASRSVTARCTDPAGNVGSASVAIRVVDPAPATAEAVASAPVVLVGAPVTLTITVRDEGGRPVVGTPVSVTGSSATGTTDGAGRVQLLVTSSTVGTVTYAVTAGGVPNLAAATVTHGTAPVPSPATIVAEVGMPVDRVLTATGFPVATLDVVGLPDGLVFDAATGRVSGVPTVAGVRSATFTATNPLGSATATVTVDVQPATPRPDLALSMSAERLRANRQGVYRLTVRNIGTATAPGPLTLVVALPSGVRYSGASGDGWRCGSVIGLVVCTRAAGLAQGATSEMQVRVDVTARAGTSVTSNARVSTRATESNRDNNTASVTRTVTR
jgi:hypothetical protein